MVLAALSLIPFLGFFFGFAAACWGLVTDRPRGVLAAALGGAGALLNIAVLAVIGMSIAGRSHSGGVSALIAQSELDTLVNHLELYQSEHQRYPAQLADLPRPGVGRSLPLIDHSLGLLNVTIEYRYAVQEDGSSYVLRGVGKDGVPESPDDVYPTGQDPFRVDSTTPGPEATRND
jgi:hypothetical protein